MAVCDLCGSAGSGTCISAENMREAVFKKGFNPFALGLITNPLTALLPADQLVADWKGTVAQDTSDWNICAGCMPKLAKHLGARPKAAGITTSSVWFTPAANAAATEAVQRRYDKKWWQFWK
jgi:hypothetical protein